MSEQTEKPDQIPPTEPRGFAAQNGIDATPTRADDAAAPQSTSDEELVNVPGQKPGDAHTPAQNNQNQPEAGEQDSGQPAHPAPANQPAQDETGDPTAPMPIGAQTIQVPAMPTTEQETAAPAQPA